MITYYVCLWSVGVQFLNSHSVGIFFSPAKFDYFSHVFEAFDRLNIAIISLQLSGCILDIIDVLISRIISLIVFSWLFPSIDLFVFGSSDILIYKMAKSSAKVKQFNPIPFSSVYNSA